MKNSSEVREYMRRELPWGHLVSRSQGDNRFLCIFEFLVSKKCKIMFPSELYNVLIFLNKKLVAERYAGLPKVSKLFYC